MMIEMLQNAAAVVLVLVAALLVGTLLFAWTTDRLERPKQAAVGLRRKTDGRGAGRREVPRDHSRV